MRPRQPLPIPLAVLLALFCIGCGFFVLFGVAAILPSIVAGRYQTDGLSWIPSSRYGRVVYVLLGPCILTLMATIAAWIAFGPGIRHFSRTTDQNAGRSGFAVAAVLFAVLGIRWTIVGVRWLRQPDNDQHSDLF
jgi:hypothetical protein